MKDASQVAVQRYVKDDGVVITKIDLDGNGVPDMDELGAWARAALRLAWWLVKAFAADHTIAKRVVVKAEAEGIRP